MTAVLCALLTACSGGKSDGSPAQLPGCADGSQDLCIVRCNLGCTSDGGCSITNIGVNQRIDFGFNFEVDPASVSTNTIKLRDERGSEPIGSFFVQGGNVSFLPRVEQIGDRTFFGFTSGRTYTLTIPGKGGALNTLRSKAGDSLGKDFSCRLAVTRGVIDFDGRAPRAALLVPDSIGPCIERRTSFLLEFSELVDPLTLAAPARGVQFRIAAGRSQGRCAPNSSELPGVRKLSVDPVTQRTRLEFTPSRELPPDYCVRVEITDVVRDVSGQRAKPSRFEIRTCAGAPTLRTITEAFADPEQQDEERGAGVWSGRLVAPDLGGSGRHGDADHRAIATRTDLRDADGREIWVVNSDRITVKADRTLDQREDIVTNGILEFTSFVVPSGVRLRFVGSKVPQLRVAGNASIDGAIDVSAEATRVLTLQGTIVPQRGQAGARGGAGGGDGGRGGDSPLYRGSDARYDGTRGASVQLPSGHPSSAEAPATAGNASRANPESALAKDVIFSSLAGGLSQMTAAGGAGGAFVTAGGSGRCIDNGASAHGGDPIASDFGAVSAASRALDFAQMMRLPRRSSRLFLIGGAGGGGAGTHTSGWFPPQNNDPLTWSPGHGGGGGGGALHISCGRDFRVATRGLVLARGSDAQRYVFDFNRYPNAAPGGAGSGGSILVQIGGLFDIRGRVDARGGAAGRYSCAISQLRVDSLSGAGGDGFLRLESTPAPSLAQLTTLRPAVGATNVGKVHPGDHTRQSVTATKWYDTGAFFTPRYLRYEIDAVIDDVPVRFSDDAARGSLAEAGAAIEVLFQAAELDPQSGRAVASTMSTWQSARIAGLNNLRGHAFRVLLRFDRSVAREIVVRAMRFFYES